MKIRSTRIIPVKSFETIPGQSPERVVASESCDTRPIPSTKNQKFLIVDLSVPRNIEAHMSDIDGLDLINVDGLKDIVNKNYNKRKAEVNKAQLLIDEYLTEFDEWASSRQLRPSILSIKSKIKNLIENNYKVELNGNLVSNDGKKKIRFRYPNE